jgi:hypothetical protein
MVTPGGEHDAALFEDGAGSATMRARLQAICEEFHRRVLAIHASASAVAKATLEAWPVTLINELSTKAERGRGTKQRALPLKPIRPGREKLLKHIGRMPGGSDEKLLRIRVDPLGPTTESNDAV